MFANNSISKSMPRRQAIRSLMGGSMLMPGIFSELLASSSGSKSPLAARTPQHPAKAEQVIWIYLSGGFSHLDTFDPKPGLFKAANAAGAQSKKNKTRYMPSPWDFQKCGQSGIDISDLFPHLRDCADDLCMIRSLHTDHGNHQRAALGIHTGSFAMTRPSAGSWVSYGLGTLNENLPSFVVLAPKIPYSGAQLWGSSFLPGEHQGTRVLPSANPVPNLQRLSASSEQQNLELDLLKQYNAHHLKNHPTDPNLKARIQSYETAFGMQMEMPQVLDFSKESDATHKLYGLERGSTKGFAWQCLAARRMVESGVRFIELIDTGASNNWDAHGNIDTHIPLAKNIDQPIAGLLKDLKSRGMLEKTLVVCTTEFGRTPTFDGSKGRGHHKNVFTSWLAGGGSNAGTIVGSSDELGSQPLENPVHVNDFHATILHLLGMDHERLTWYYGGRDHRLTDLAGRVVPEILA
ncbi:MAG: DUF1501 domain-containing protein [Verrucomicrobiota bacterium]